MHVGHDGAMPGFLAGVYGRRGGDGTRRRDGLRGARLLRHRRRGRRPAAPAARRRRRARPGRDRAVAAGRSPPRDVPARLLGRWWGEGFEYVFSWHDGALRARGADDPAGKPPAVFAPLPDRPDVFRTVSGREVGRAAAADPGRRRARWSGCTGRPTGSPAARRPSTGTTSGDRTGSTSTGAARKWAQVRSGVDRIRWEQRPHAGASRARRRDRRAGGAGPARPDL